MFSRNCSQFSKSCELGVGNCYENEECFAVSARRKDGCCECSTGFTRNLTGACLQSKVIESETTDAIDTTFPSSISTVTTPSTTTTTRYIRHLAIHISPTAIQLPELKSNITAIVVPDPEEGEEYSYFWTVLAYPLDMQPATTIEGNNEKTLKLSQLSPGNYTFHIKVSSPNSFGETIENLTVLAREFFL